MKINQLRKKLHYHVWVLFYNINFYCSILANLHWQWVLLHFHIKTFLPTIDIFLGLRLLYIVIGCWWSLFTIISFFLLLMFSNDVISNYFKNFSCLLLEFIVREASPTTVKRCEADGSSKVIISLIYYLFSRT